MPNNNNRTKFHSRHGPNIILIEENTIAHRKQSFANALCFSEKPLRLSELFLIEINSKEVGWSGHLRLGLTQINPESIEHLPQYALPDLTNLSQLGLSWIFPISKSAPRQSQSHTLFENEKSPFLKTSFGNVNRNLLHPGITERNNEDMLPTDTGSRIGVIFTPMNENNDFAQMHFIVNGDDLGPQAVDIPYKNGPPLYVCIDVYGTTKQVKIIQLYSINSLKSLTKEVILSSVERKNLKLLPLPQPLKDYLK